MAQDGNPRHVSLVGPLILITIGALFLLHNWRPDFEPWPIVRTYWPLILVFIGLGKIWDNMERTRNPNAPRGTSIGATIGFLAFVVVLVALLWHGKSFSRRHGWEGKMMHTMRVVEPQRAKSANARLDMSAGQLTVSGGSANLLDADFNYNGSYDEPRVDYTVTNEVGDLNIRQEGGSVHFGNSRNEWNLRFGKDVPLNLKVEMGAGQGNLHLRDVPLTDLRLDIGAGEVNVDLTGDRKTDLTAELHGGVGHANIRLPKNVGVEARASGGIGSIDVRGLKHDGDRYTNDALGKSKATIHLKVEGGIGQIELIQEQ